jgi:hypothetical protein
MTSNQRADAAFVWIWLPDRDEPVIAGRVDRRGDRLVFGYGTSYLERDDAIAVYDPELPLRRGMIEPLDGCRSPDASSMPGLTRGVDASSSTAFSGRRPETTQPNSMT